MKNIRITLLAAMGVAALGVLGCGGSASEEVYVESDQPAYLTVDEAPPDAPVEVISESPGPDFIWVGGFYSWGGGGYHWHRGQWQRPPAGGGTWVAPRFERGDHGGRFLPGHWQRGGRAAAPQINRAQPAERAARQPAPAPAPVHREETHTTWPGGRTPPPTMAGQNSHVSNPKEAPKKGEAPKGPGDGHGESHGDDHGGNGHQDAPQNQK